ncbi:hypothetical protein COB64_02950 [Candidatus Wolfebacteria bacterium]|nr:MAG: hypothetical protein COB64_02950 [Candidatus Wolfebacteria bacterium]
MTLKQQKKARKESWTLDNVREGLDRFYKEHNRYPTAHEFDNFIYLPSSRTIQRKFGGLVQLREELNLKGPKDFTKGDYSSQRAYMINKRAHETEKEVYEYLVNRFGVQFVHREFFFLDDKRTRTDFFIYYNDSAFSIDVFYPKDRPNLIGCLNNKLRKYSDETMMQYPVFFLQMNIDIDQRILDDIVKNKKNMLQKNQYLVTFKTLKRFCEDKEPLSLKK